MLRLVLMRHARAAGLLAPDGSGVVPGGDHERPLEPAGREDAADVGAALAARGWIPDAVVSSDSARTRQTWACLTASLGAPPVRFSPALYHADAGTLLDELGGVDADVRTLLVLGHNPGLQELAYELTGEDVGLATANALLLRSGYVSWPEALRPRRWHLEALVRPKGH